MNILLLLGIQMVFLGDFLPTHRLGYYIQKSPIHPVKGVYPLLMKSDLVVVNLESPITDTGRPAEKKYTFRIPEAFSPYFKLWKINCVTLANNHMMDYGTEGLKRTLLNLNGHGIMFTGAGMNLKEATEPVIYKKDGVKVAIFSFSLTLPESFYAGHDKPGTAYGSYGTIERCLRQWRDSVDFLVVTFHWSSELLDTPKVYQRRIARWCIDKGADLVIGHHPHVVQPFEIYKKRLIVYSLGNFAFGTFSERGTGEIVVADLRKDSIDYRIIPLEVKPSSCNFSPYPATGGEGITLPLIPHRPPPFRPHPRP